MASVVHAIPGKLYKGPFTSVASGGTLISGIEGSDIAFALDADLNVRRSGIGASAGPRMRYGRVRACVLLIPLRNHSTAGLLMLLSHLTTDGTVMRPTGGTALADWAKMPPFDLVVRPTLTTEKHLYCPNWSVTLGTEWLARNSEVGAQLSGAHLALMACRPTNATGPAYEWAASATIDTAYGLGGEA